MTEQKQPEALRLAELLELAPEDGVEPQTTEDAAAELRRQHTRIAELEARIKTMAEERADELTVAHMDGRMRAAQPAGAQQPGDERAAFERWSKVTNQGYDLARNVSGKLQTFESTETEHAWRGFFHGLRASHWQAPAQAAPQQDTAGVTAGAAPDGWKLVPVEPAESMLSEVDEEVGGHCHSCTKWRASYDDCRRIYAAMLAAAPQPSKEQP